MTTPIASSFIPPEAGVSEISRNEFQSRLAGVGNLGGKNISPAQKEKKLREACEGFESIFIQKMWEEMRKTLPKSTMLHGKEEDFWQGMYDQELAKKMTSAGGIGLADMMFTQLSSNLASASKTTATDGTGAHQRGFTPEVAPMLPPRPAEENRSADTRAGQTSAQRQAAAGNRAVYNGNGAGQLGNGSDASLVAVGDLATNNLTPEQAAALQEQQALQAIAQQPERHKVVRTTNVKNNRNSALDLARMAQFEAGTKLGPNGVRPPLQQIAGIPQTSRSTYGQGAGQAQASRQADMNDLSIPPLMGGDAFNSQSMNMGSPAAMQTAMSPSGAQPTQDGFQDQGMGQQNRAAARPSAPQKIRYTTNVPANAKSGKQDLMRMLNVDGTSPNSNAGAGIAAYHAQQMNGPSVMTTTTTGAQSSSRVDILPMAPGGRPINPASVQPSTPGASSAAPQFEGQPTPELASPGAAPNSQITVRKGGGIEPSTTSGIPPLTASDMLKRP
jgi:peptidoglycan hydrolase FlgJ